MIQKLSGLKLQNNIILEKERGNLFDTLKEVYNLKITILNFTGGITERIEEMLETKRDISLIVIDDYNDLMYFEQNALIKIKALSKCFNMPMLLCGHLIKQTDKIKNQKPNMNDLGRRSIYFDIILFLHRDAYYPPIDDNNDPNLTELLVAKNNNGEIGIVNLYFDYKNVSFREYKI